VHLATGRNEWMVVAFVLACFLIGWLCWGVVNDAMENDDGGWE